MDSIDKIVDEFFGGRVTISRSEARSFARLVVRGDGKNYRRLTDLSDPRDKVIVVVESWQEIYNAMPGLEKQIIQDAFNEVKAVLRRDHRFRALDHYRADSLTASIARYYKQNLQY